MRRSGIRALWTIGAMLASLATGPSVFAQTAHHKAAAAAHQANSKHIVGAAQDSAAAAQAAAQAQQPGNAQPGGTMDTAPGAMAAPAPTGSFVDTTGTGTYGGQTSTAGGTYDQATGGRGHNWGWIGLFGLLGLLGLRGRTSTTMVDDHTASARPQVNARP